MAKLRYKILEDDFSEIVKSGIEIGYFSGKLYWEGNIKERKDLAKSLKIKIDAYEKKMPKSISQKLCLPFSIFYMKSLCDKILN